MPAVPWDSNAQGGYVTALCQDRQGHVWAASESAGVWEFSPSSPVGRQWTQFTAENTGGGLGDDDCYSLACDRLGRIWAGTGRDGVSVFNGKSWKTYDRLTGPLGCHVVALATSPVSGDVWGCTESGLFCYALKTNSWTYWTRADGLPSDQPDCLAFARDGTLFVGTECDGIALASPADGYARWRHVPGPDALPDAPGGDGLPSALVNCLLVSRDGTVYAGTDAGLAHSTDNGRTWRFLRGADWKDKLANLAAPVTPRDVDTGGRLMSEDYVTALAEDGAGHLDIGHRQRGLGVYDERTARGVTPPGGYGGYVDALLVTSQGQVLIGSYGDGLQQSVASASKISVVAAQDQAPSPPLPMPASPPSALELAALARRVRKLTAPLPVGSAEYIGEDWQTQGDWVGRYGRQYAVLCAAASPLDQVMTWTHDYDVEGQLGPHHAPGDSLRHWITWAQTDNPKSLYSPVNGYRTQAEWDDHSEAMVQQGDIFAYQGPDVWVTVTVPGGVHRVSLYDMNKDGHSGDNRFRDYLVDVLPYRDNPEDAERLRPLAHARIRNFWGGVYEQFIVSGPARYYIRIGKNGSLNTLCAGVFLDRMAGDASYPDSAPMAFMHGVHYDPPDPDAPPPTSNVPAPAPAVLTAAQSESLAASRVLWKVLDKSYPNVNSIAQQAPFRLLAYRAAVADDGSSRLQAQWRWKLHVWTSDDRLWFDRNMALAAGLGRAEALANSQQ